MPAQTGIDRNMAVQEKIRRSKRGRGYEQRRPEQNAQAFGTAATAAAAATRSVKAREQRPQSPGVGQAVNTDLGGQLSRRVQSGAIDDQQAQRVAGERQLLEAKFGPQWREKVYGQTGAFQNARTKLAANPQSDRLKALVEQLMAKRKGAVEGARRKRDRGSFERFKEGASGQ